MKKLMIVTAMVALMTGCSSYPTVTSSTVDDRPTISFQSTNDNADVYVDGSLVGKVGNYKAKKTALYVLPGTHTVTIIDGKTTHQQKIFVSNGTNKIIVVK